MRTTSFVRSILFVSFFTMSCSSNFCEAQINSHHPQPGPPAYTDNGKTIDSLKKAFNSEDIEYYHWDIDNSDSCLNIGFINSDKVPSFKNVNETVRKYKAIASSIKKVLAIPENYNSYYIVFIKKEKGMGGDIRLHSGGMEMKNKDLKDVEN